MTLREYFAIGKRWWWALVFGALIGGGGAYWLTSRSAPIYEATAQITVNQIQDPGGLTYNTILGNQSLTVTYARLATSSTNLAQAAADLGLTNLEAEKLEDTVSSRAISNTFLIEISAQDEDAERAALIANAVARALPDFIREVQLAGGAGQAVNTVFVSDPAVPAQDPLSRHERRNAFFGAFFGLAAVAFLVLFAEYLNDGIDEQADIEALDVPFIGNVFQGGQVGEGPWEHVPSIWEDPSSPTAESFRQLHARLTFSLAADPAKIIIVTSALKGEGKSTVTANLAEAMADAGRRVILVDGDLRRPRLHRYFSLPNQAGLMSAFLAGPKTAHSFVASINERLGVLTTSRAPGSIANVLASERMLELLHSLADHADAVIVDTPPLLGIADTSHWLAMADGVILVARRGKSRQGPVREALTMIETSGVPLLGVTLNGVPVRALDYYGYETSREDDELESSSGWTRRLMFWRSGFRQ